MTNLPVHEGADFDTVVEDVHLGAWLVFHVGGLQHLIAINRGISVTLCVTRLSYVSLDNFGFGFH